MSEGLQVVAMVWDGGIADVFNSTYIVPVFGTVMALGIVLANVWAGVRRREMELQERLAAIAKGLPLPPTKSEIELTQDSRAAGGPSKQRAHSRTAGLVLSSIGIGVVVFGVLLTLIVRNRMVLTVAAAGFIPLAMGIGLLLDARLRARDMSEGGAIARMT